MIFLARCPHCGTEVTAITILDDQAIKEALATDADIEAMHPTDASDDHAWKLNTEEKANLRKHFERG
jgi:hypothetical protein